MEKGGYFSKLRWGEPKPMTFAGNNDQVRLHASALQFSVKLLALCNGNQSIAIAMKNEEGRRIGVDMIDGTCLLRQRSLLGDSAA